MRFKVLDEQPITVEIKMADGIFIKSHHVKKADTYLPQHSHTYDHTSMIARGSVRVWKNGWHIGDFVAPKGIIIEANTKHIFVTLEDDTIIYCIHNISRTGEIDIHEENNLPEG
jgi:quercetin dioxygenase-like cupin family protein